MTLFGADFKDKLQRALVTRYQGLDLTGLTTKELLQQLFQGDREAFKRLMADMFTPKYDPEREANIHRVKEIDKVDFRGDSDIDTDKTFDTFRLTKGSVTVSQAFNAAIGWAKGMSPYLLTLSGPPGVGKTHLALAAARLVLHRDNPIIYRTEKAVLDELHQAMRKGEDGPVQVMEQFAEIPWLVLDDLGAGATSEWDKSHMDQLVNLRWQGTGAQQRTLVTTNLVGETMTPRMASRLGDIHVGKAIIIKAEDYRRTTKAWKGWVAMSLAEGQSCLELSAGLVKLWHHPPLLAGRLYWRATGCY